MIIDAKSLLEETNEISGSDSLSFAWEFDDAPGFGSLHLKHPLMFDHRAGTIISTTLGTSSHWVADEQGFVQDILAPPCQLDAHGDSIHINLGHHQRHGGGLPLPLRSSIHGMAVVHPVSQKTVPARPLMRARSGSESPPTPPPPEMPKFLQPSLSTSFSSSWSPPPLPAPWKGLTAFPQPPVPNTLGQVPLPPPSVNGLGVAEVQSLNRRMNTTLDQCRTAMAGAGLERTQRRAEKLEQEMKDIEAVCAEMGGDWHQIQAAMETMRSDLMQRAPGIPNSLEKVRSGSEAIESPSLSHSDRGQLRSHRLLRNRSNSTSKFSTVSSSPSRLFLDLCLDKPKPAELPPSTCAREAFRARLANKMHVYDKREGIWDLDGVYEEMDSIPQGAARTVDPAQKLTYGYNANAAHDEQSWHPPPNKPPLATSKNGALAGDAEQFWPSPPNKLPPDASQNGTSAGQNARSSPSNKLPHNKLQREELKRRTMALMQATQDTRQQLSLEASRRRAGMN